MSSIAKSSISLSKKDLTKSKNTMIASRNVVFYHKTSGGETIIDLNNLSMPSEMPTQVQATIEEISGARLTVFKKNLKLVSSANGELIQGLDYLVLDGYTIQLIGPYETVGAEAAEIFVGTVGSVPMSDLTVVSTQDVVKTYTLAVGQNILNLAQEYTIGTNPLENIGSMKVWVNGVLALRDQDYVEVEAGDTGFGSTIQFLSSPVSVPWQVVVDFGVRAITDTNAMGTIESLSGAVKKIANDLADVAGTSASDYLTANPSEIERRTFGDTMLAILDLEMPVLTEWSDFPSVAAGTLITSTTTNPQYGVVAVNRARYRRVGSHMEIQWDYRQTATTGSAAGSGTHYLFNLPPGYEIDTTVAGANTGTTGGDNDSIVGIGNFSQPVATSSGSFLAAVYDSTKIKFAYSIGNNGGSTDAEVWRPIASPFTVATISLGIKMSVPIKGWQSKQKIKDILGL